jgi:5-formyltetrahydrofolate cyclo-ligase
METTMQLKAQLRREMLRRRAAIPAAERSGIGEAIHAQVVSLDAFRTARCIAGYVAVGAEIDPAPILATARSDEKQVLVPAESGFVPMTASEPSRGAGSSASGCGLPSVILVPGVAFDRSGGRLGRGAGYYDRVLAQLAGAVRVGIAADLQVLDRVPRDPWDIPMDYIVTETRLLHVGGRFEEIRS